MFIYIKIFIIINYIERQQTKKYQLEVKLLCVEESNQNLQLVEAEKNYKRDGNFIMMVKLEVEEYMGF